MTATPQTVVSVAVLSTEEDYAIIAFHKHYTSNYLFLLLIIYKAHTTSGMGLN